MMIENLCKSHETETDSMIKITVPDPPVCVCVCACVPGCVHACVRVYLKVQHMLINVKQFTK